MTMNGMRAGWRDWLIGAMGTVMLAGGGVSLLALDRVDEKLVAMHERLMLVQAQLVTLNSARDEQLALAEVVGRNANEVNGLRLGIKEHGEKLADLNGELRYLRARINGGRSR